MSFKSDKLTVYSILVMNLNIAVESCMTLYHVSHILGMCDTRNSIKFKLRHSTICTLYSSQWMKTKCTRCNMRSTCQWSCVLQFTWRRAVCCGLHRPMSQVIPCLRLVFDIIHIRYIFNRHRQNDFYSCWTWEVFTPWRKPLTTNNRQSSQSHASTKEFKFCLLS